MYCTSCGKEISSDDRICPSCGAYVPETAAQADPAQPDGEQSWYGQSSCEQPAYGQTAGLVPAYAEQSRERQAAPGGVTPTKIMVLGIIAAALAELGIPGIILGAIAMSNSNRYVAAGGVACGQSKTGRVLGRVGLIAGIAMTVFWIVYVIIYAAMFSYMYSYY